MRVRWGTFGSVPTIFGIMPNVVGRQGAFSITIQEYWHGASDAGKVPNVQKVLGRISPFLATLNLFTLPKYRFMFM